MDSSVIEKAANYIKKRMKNIPEAGVILGSGLSGFAESIEDAVIVPYEDIPGFPVSTAPGHVSRIVCGFLNGVCIMIFQGRFHHYEGYDLDSVTMPVKVLNALGCRKLILTNASGGINRKFAPGDLMLLTDHINMTGMNPLTGPNDESSGPRFPDLSEAYSPDLRELAIRAADDAGVKLNEGVYAWMTGPSFETPAEIRMLEIIGADAVGMSTVPEVISAAHLGMDVLAVSYISNMAAGILQQPVTAEEVIDIGRKITRDFVRFLSSLVYLMRLK